MIMMKTILLFIGDYDHHNHRDQHDHHDHHNHHDHHDHHDHRDHRDHHDQHDQHYYDDRQVTSSMDIMECFEPSCLPDGRLLCT